MAGKKGRSGGPRPGFGGKQPGAGRPPKNPKIGESEAVSPLDFLEGVMRDPSVEDRLRVQAAIAACQYRHTKLSDGGKKDARKEAAEAAADGKFSGAAPPRLVRDNTKAA